MTCDACGEPDMIFYPGEEFEEDGSTYWEPDAYGCPECGYMVVV